MSGASNELDGARSRKPGPPGHLADPKSTAGFRLTQSDMRWPAAGGPAVTLVRREAFR